MTQGEQDRQGEEISVTLSRADWLRIDTALLDTVLAAGDERDGAVLEKLRGQLPDQTEGEG